MHAKPYPRYKASGVEWLRDVPTHWDVKRLKWTTTGTINGVWGEEPNDIDDLICVRVADFDRDQFVVVGRPPTIRAIDLSQRRGRILERGDLLIEKSGGGEKQLVGCVVFFDHSFNAVCSNFVARMPILAPHSPRFWTYVHAALYSGRLNYPAVKQTTGIQNLDSASYLDTRVGFPPSAEQQAIANFLDHSTSRIDVLVEKKQALIDRLKEKRSALVSLTVTHGLPAEAARAAGLNPNLKLKSSGIVWLGDVPAHWEVKPLGYLVKFLGGATPDKANDEYWDGDIPWVSPKDMKRSRISDTEDHISQEGYANSPLPMIEPHCVLIVVRGMILAHSFPLAINEIPVTINQDMKALRPIEEISSEFLFWTLSGLSRALVALADESAHGTRKLESAILAKFGCLVPPLQEQLAISEYLNRETSKIDGMVVKVEEATKRLREYRTALVTAAVTGKIDVRRQSTDNRRVLASAS